MHRWDRLQFPLELPWPFQVLFIRAGLSNSRAEGTGGDISRVPAWTRAAQVPGLTGVMDEEGAGCSPAGLGTRGSVFCWALHPCCQ